MKRAIALLLAAALTVGLSGCGLMAPEELYVLPQASPEYESLQNSLGELLGRGYEYAAPLSGSNTQSVQLEDLDGDGQDEAVAFLRDSSGENKPLKICIFRSDGEGSYYQAAMIEGDGDAVNSVVYCQLNGTPTEELVVGWRISSSVYTLSAYSIENDNVTELLNAPSYTKYAVQDMDQDNQAEIISILLQGTEDEGNTATYYDWNEDTMMSINTVQLSASADSLESLRYHRLVDGYPALFITSYLRDNTTQVVTDVLSVTDKILSNLTLSSETGESVTTRMNLAEPRDVNNDSVLELPMVTSLRSSSAVDNSDSFYVIDWVQFDREGQSYSQGYTYHNTADSWYLDLPEGWLTVSREGEVSGLILSRNDTNVGATVERSITFYHQGELTEEPVRFLTIYQNTGSNRDTRSVMGERFLLLQEQEAVYSAELFTDDWDCGVSQAELAQLFHLIVTDWSVD